MLYFNLNYQLSFSWNYYEMVRLRVVSGIPLAIA